MAYVRHGWYCYRYGTYLPQLTAGLQVQAPAHKTIFKEPSTGACLGISGVGNDQMLSNGVGSVGELCHQDPYSEKMTACVYLPRIKKSIIRKHN